jgi:hypothetical protein
MQDPATYTEAFEREHGCTVAEWRQWLPGAAGESALAFDGDHAAQVALPGGTLRLRWAALPPRQIALIRMPRLQVSYRFDGPSADERARFMRRFDLYMQRGGG